MRLYARILGSSTREYSRKGVPSPPCPPRILSPPSSSGSCGPHSCLLLLYSNYAHNVAHFGPPHGWRSRPSNGGRRVLPSSALHSGNGVHRSREHPRWHRQKSSPGMGHFNGPLWATLMWPSRTSMRLYIRSTAYVQTHTGDQYAFVHTHTGVQYAYIQTHTGATGPH